MMPTASPRKPAEVMPTRTATLSVAVIAPKMRPRVPSWVRFWNTVIMPATVKAPGSPTTIMQAKAGIRLSEISG